MALGPVSQLHSSSDPHLEAKVKGKLLLLTISGAASPLPALRSLTPPAPATPHDTPTSGPGFVPLFPVRTPSDPLSSDSKQRPPGEESQCSRGALLGLRWKKSRRSAARSPPSINLGEAHRHSRLHPSPTPPHEQPAPPPAQHHSPGGSPWRQLRSRPSSSPLSLCCAGEKNWHRSRCVWRGTPRSGEPRPMAPCFLALSTKLLRWHRSSASGGCSAARVSAGVDSMARGCC